MHRDRKGVSKILVSLALIVVIIAACVFIYASYRSFTVSEAPEEPFFGTCQIKVTGSNWADQSDVSETSPTYKAYHTNGKTLNQMVKADFIGGVTLTADSATDMDVTRDDQGSLALWIYAGSAHFLDIELTRTANSRIKAVRTDLDVNADGKRDTLLQYYVGDIAAPGVSIKPVTQLDLKLVPDETGDLTINNLTTQVFGTGAKTGSVEWQISDFEEKKGWALARVYITQNRTDEDMVKVTGVSIGYGVGQFSGSDITYEAGAKRWSVNIGVANYRAVQDGILIKRPVAGTSYLSITISVETYFTGAAEGADHVAFTVYVDEINPAGSITTDFDAMVLADA